MLLVSFVPFALSHVFRNPKHSILYLLRKRTKISDFAKTLFLAFAPLGFAASLCEELLTPLLLTQLAKVE